MVKRTRHAVRQAVLLGALLQEPAQVQLHYHEGQAMVCRLGDGQDGAGAASGLRRGRALRTVAAHPHREHEDLERGRAQASQRLGTHTTHTRTCSLWRTWGRVRPVHTAAYTRTLSRAVHAAGRNETGAAAATATATVTAT